MNSTNSTIRNLLIVDGRVPDWQRLVEGISGDNSLLVLDPSADGLTQISEYLLGLSANIGAESLVAFDSLQIISHGGSGNLLLGSSRLNSDSLDHYAANLAAIGKALTADGDLLLYGCNVAEGEIGRLFIDRLAQYTGADVAASNDLTGSDNFGGNWSLEVETGAIETNSVISPFVQENYGSLLSVDDYADNTGTSGSVAIGGSVSGNIDIVNDQDWFKVDLVAGTRYVFDLSGKASGGGTLGNNFGIPALWLRNPQGNLIDDAISGGPGDDPRMAYMPTASGTYYLEVFELGDDRTGTYTLKASVASTTDDYADNTGTSGSVTIGGSSTGNIDIANDHDWFKVDLEAGTRYMFDLSGKASGGGTLGNNFGIPALWLRNPQGNLIDDTISGGPGDDPRMAYLPTASGTYYLEVWELGDDRAGTYTLKASLATSTDDYVDNTGTTGQIAIGGSTKGNIELAHDHDWFKVDLEAGTRYVFDLSGKASGGGTLGNNFGIPALWLRNPQGNLIDDTISGGPGDDPRMAYIPTASGTYYLEVFELGDDRTGAYTLKASVATSIDDYADNTGTAGKITIGGSAKGIIDIANDHDWFKVDLEAGTRYMFDLSGKASGGGTLGNNFGIPALWLRNPQGNLIDDTISGGAGDDPRMAYIPTASGTYYLEVFELGDDRTGTYTLKVSAATTADDYADTTGTAGQIAIGGSAKGNIDLANDHDWFKVDLVAGTRYVFDLSGLASGGGTLGNNFGIPALWLRNPQGNLIDDTISGGPGDDPRMAYTPTVSGTYYLEVFELGDDRTGTYTLSVIDANGIDGDASNNTLNGTDAGDLIQGLAGDDTLNGGLGDDILEAGAGNDTLNGGDGDDRLLGDVGNDILNGGNGIDWANYNTAKAGVKVDLSLSKAQNTGGAGIDTLIAIENLLGSRFNDKLSGNAADNVIDGGFGIDVLIGGLGDDHYFVDLIQGGKSAKIEDGVIEKLKAGLDTLTLRSASLQLGKASLINLAANVENLDAGATGSTWLNFTGNSSDNRILGNDADNVIDGGLGKDDLRGGLGNDSYRIDNVLDSITENAAQGIDSVFVNIASAGGGYQLGGNIENATLVSKVVYDLTGNELDNRLVGNAAKNTLNGGDGNDSLNGGAGADLLLGGTGDDVYFVDHKNDMVTENVGEGNDLVNSAVTFTLADFIENLTLTGKAAVNGAGNGDANAITGNGAANKLSGNGGDDRLFGMAGSDVLDGGDGDDLLAGGAGKDTLTGGAGGDTFRFDAAANAGTNKDTLTDFASGTDKLQFRASVFAALGEAGQFAADDGRFYASATGVAHDADDRLIYNTATGVLSYDVNGNGSGGAIAVAVLGTSIHPMLTSADFWVG